MGCALEGGGMTVLLFVLGLMVVNVILAVVGWLMGER